MCFRIHPKHNKQKVAKKDITCYKMLEANGSGLSSPFQDYIYEPGVAVTSAVIPTHTTYGGVVIHKGLHSLSSKQEAEYKRILHIAYGQPNTVIKEAIIPKGSIYWYNPDDKEYVSNCLIIKA